MSAVAACRVTGYTCVHPAGHGGPHEARDGRQWGGERCDHRHVFWPHRSRCLCGEMKIPAPLVGARPVWSVGYRAGWRLAGWQLEREWRWAA